MKKIIFLKIIILFTLFIVQSCEKSESVSQDEIEIEINDDGFTENEFAENIEDELETYQTEAKTKIDSITPFSESDRCKASDNDDCTEAFKYSNFIKLHIIINAAVTPSNQDLEGTYIIAHLSQADTIVSATSTTANTEISEISEITPRKWKMKMKPTSTWDKPKNRNISLITSKNISIKKSAKFVLSKVTPWGNNTPTMRAIYGTNGWGYIQNTTDTINHTQYHRYAVDSSYIPDVNDVLEFENGLRASIYDPPLGTAITIKDAVPATATKPAKSEKVKFKYEIWNSDCKSTRTRKTVNQYISTFPNSIVIPNGTSKIKYYYR